MGSVWRVRDDGGHQYAMKILRDSMMLSGPLSTLLNNATITKYMLSDTTVSKANELAKEVQSEAITMLKNDDSNLPLSNKKVNVFGWGSTNPVYGGTGSGSMSDQYETVSMLDGMKQAGIETNSELTKLYTDYRKDRPVVAMWSQDWTLPEVPAKQYSDTDLRRQGLLRRSRHHHHPRRRRRR